MDDQTIPTRHITLTTAASSGPVTADERMVLAPSHDTPAPNLHAGRAVPQQATLSILGASGARLSAGIAARPAEERVFRTRRKTELTITTPGGDAAADPRERVIISRDDEWLRPSPMAG
jgi:hypothetical protein